MYNLNSATMIRMSEDHNRKMLERIPSGERVQSQTPGYKILARIIAGVSDLFTRIPVKQTNTDAQPVSENNAARVAKRYSKKYRIQTQ